MSTPPEPQRDDFDFVVFTVESDAKFRDLCRSLADTGLPSDMDCDFQDGKFVRIALRVVRK